MLLGALLEATFAFANPQQNGNHPLDLQRMFMGDEKPLFLVEVALRTTIIFVYTLVLLRMLGKRGVAQLSLFEVTIIIGLGSAVGDPMFQADVPLVHAMLVITIIIFLYRGFTVLIRRSQSFEKFVEGTPSCLVSGGRLELEALTAERISQEELFEILRVAGITHLGEVKRAYLEQSGQLSIFSYPPKEIVAGLPIVPPWDISDKKAIEATKEAVDPGTYACRMCGEVAKPDVRRALPTCPKCEGREWLVASTEPLGPNVTGAARD